MSLKIASAKPKPARVENLPIDMLLPSRYQMRVAAYEKVEDLQQLALLIESEGLMEIPWVRPHPEKEDFYELVSGHRRIAAIRRFLLSHDRETWGKIPCEIYENVPEETILKMAGTSNLARRNLYPYEKGIYFRMWAEKYDPPDIATRFGYPEDAIIGWLDLQMNVDRLSQSVSDEEKKQFMLKVTKDKLKAIKQLEAERDIVEAIRMVIRGAELPDVKMFVEACLNAAARLRGSTLAQEQREQEESPSGKGVMAELNKLSRSVNLKEAMEHAKKLGRMLQPTLEEFERLQAALGAAKSKDKIKITGKINVTHKVEKDGTVYCIHEIKGAKKPIITKFKVHQ